jgi:peptidoglycan/LPS O-acetylase OafA/YrhL
MPNKNTATRVVLVLYAAASVAIAAPIAFGARYSGDLAATTSGRILVAALLALALGAALAARDPWRNRVTVQVLIAFTLMATVAIAYRLATEDQRFDPAWAPLVLSVAACAVLVRFYPRPPEQGRGRPRRDRRPAEEAGPETRDGRP